MKRWGTPRRMVLQSFIRPRRLRPGLLATKPKAQGRTPQMQPYDLMVIGSAVRAAKRTPRTTNFKSIPTKLLEDEPQGYWRASHRPSQGGHPIPRRGQGINCRTRFDRGLQLCQKPSLAGPKLEPPVFCMRVGWPVRLQQFAWCNVRGGPFSKEYSPIPSKRSPAR